MTKSRKQYTKPAMEVVKLPKSILLASIKKDPFGGDDVRFASVPAAE